MRTNFFCLVAFICFAFHSVIAQNGYWQQQADYSMQITLDDSKDQLIGHQDITYYNRSSDTLKKVYFHLYYNAFKASSNAAVWSKETKDLFPNAAFHSLKPKDEGDQKIKQISVGGKSATVKYHGSILEVILAEPILPNSEAILSVDFEAVIPACIQRGGKKNSVGIAYTLTQWYPKLCRYDRRGWHLDQYIGREFAGTFGNYDVKITLPKDYVIAGTGVLQNISYKEKGYDIIDKLTSTDKLTTWHFKAENVHDFAWAADKNYSHFQEEIDGITFHYFYLYKKPFIDTWGVIRTNMKAAYQVAKENFGAYPYPQFSFIQAGEGYMEYPMCTMMESGSTQETYSTAFHEFMHSWYYGILGSDENLYPWMDEGLTSYAEARLSSVVKKKENFTEESMDLYRYIRSKVGEEPMSTAANYYRVSATYYSCAYYKAQMFIEQLNYILGEKTVKKGLLTYFERWKFKHPTPDDFVRVMEDVSGIHLMWYQNIWLNTTKTVDLAIGEVKKQGKETQIIIEKRGDVPMPAEVLVQLKDGTSLYYYIPLDIMYGSKDAAEFERNDVKELPAWLFTASTYTITVPVEFPSIAKVVVDPAAKLADLNRNNNSKEY